jgi:hypothetical protein
MTRINEEERKRPAGRPGKAPDPEAVAERRRVLVRVRNRAYSILAQRHAEEYLDIKNDILVRHGHQPIESAYATKVARASVEDPL